MVVTGANTGIGFETARALASAGARVLLACRNPKAGAAAVARIKELHPDSKPELSELDLASFDSVRAFAARIDAPSIDVVVANAGLMNTGYKEVQSGFEHTVGVCHLGHFLLVRELLPKLLEGGRGRVVMVSSESHRHPKKLDFDRLPLTADDYSALVSYGQAKLCNVLFANELQRRFGDDGLTACSLHPGNLVTTDIGRRIVLDAPRYAIGQPVHEKRQPGRGDQRPLRRASRAGGSGRPLFFALSPGEEQPRIQRRRRFEAPVGPHRGLGRLTRACTCRHGADRETSLRKQLQGAAALVRSFPCIPGRLDALRPFVHWRIDEA